MNTWLLTRLVSAVLLPPLNLALLALAGFLLRKRRRRFGLALCWVSLLALLFLCTAAGARLLMAPLEAMSSPLTSPRAADAQAIVVLGGGRIMQAPEYGGHDIPAHLTLARLRYAAHLHRQTGLPLLVSGGKPDGSGESEAAIMARVLREDFAVPVKWVEGESADTAANARLSAAMPQAAGIKRVLLVTDAIHMPRAMTVFGATGLKPVAAPIRYASARPLGVADFIPNGQALEFSHYAMHEWIGLLWYRLRYGSRSAGDHE